LRGPVTVQRGLEGTLGYAYQGYSQVTREVLTGYSQGAHARTRCRSSCSARRTPPAVTRTTRRMASSRGCEACVRFCVRGRAGVRGTRGVLTGAVFACVSAWVCALCMRGCLSAEWACLCTSVRGSDVARYCLCARTCFPGASAAFRARLCLCVWLWCVGLFLAVTWLRCGTETLALAHPRSA
jgi:hypothetical protein